MAQLFANNRVSVAGSGLMRNPAFLLIMTGTLIGFNFPLGKIAGDAHISPLLWAMLVSLGAAGMLLPALAIKRRLARPKGKTLRYIAVSAILSFVIPNILLFSVIPHAGAGYTGLMFALSPVFTLSLSLIFRMKPPNRLGIIGIGVGLVGAMIVSITRGMTPEAPAFMWILAALLIPMTLACGNVYRSLDWPEGASPDTLSFWSHSFSIAVFLCLMFVQDGTIPFHELQLAPWAATTQMVIAGLTFPIYFRLQKQGGPVLLSQIGYVAAAVGLVTATFLLGEHYSPMTWAGSGVIAFGITITIAAQMKA
ncbi:MAG: DMT family transporter [Sneathiella sp.]